MAYRGPSYSYKIRQIAESYTGVTYGITIPRNIAVQFSGCHFDINVSGNAIVMTKKEKKAEL